MPTALDAMADANPNPNWPTFLGLVLLLLVAGTFFILLSSVFGWVFGIPAVIVAIVMIGYLHYVFWGYGFSQRTAGEREEEELRRRDADPHEQDPF